MDPSLPPLLSFLPSLSAPMLALTVFSLLVIVIALRYGLFAGGALLLARWLSRRRPWLRIQERSFSPQQLRRELTYSLCTVIIFAAIVFAVFGLDTYTDTIQIYRDIDAYSQGWFWLSVGVAIVIHDLYFYVTHRLMHQGWLYRRVHRIHHLSTNPSPLAALAFHPMEAVIEAGVIVVIAIAIPIHPWALALWAMWMLTFNVIGHLGYEIYPGWVHRSRWLWWINTATGHNLHHSRFIGHYGLYTLIWDRLFGTWHPAYGAAWEKVQAQRPAASKAVKRPTRPATSRTRSHKEPGHKRPASST